MANIFNISKVVHMRYISRQRVILTTIELNVFTHKCLLDFSNPQLGQVRIEGMFSLILIEFIFFINPIFTANDVGPDQTLHSAVSDLCLHYL